MPSVIIASLWKALPALLVCFTNKLKHMHLLYLIEKRQRERERDRESESVSFLDIFIPLDVSGWLWLLTFSKLLFFYQYTCTAIKEESIQMKQVHGEQRRMISVDNLFFLLRLLFFCFVVAICDLLHAVEATYDLP